MFVECLVPIFFHWVMAHFDEDWAPMQNLLLCYLVISIGYLRYQTFIETAAPFWALAILFICAQFWMKHITENQVIHFICMWGNMELISRFLPNCFSVSELFIYSSINSFYVTFAYDSLIFRGQRLLIAGCNVSNVLSFTPWICLNFSGILYLVFRKVIPNHTTSSMVSILCGLILTFLSIHPYNEPEMVFSFLKDMVQQEIYLILYIAVTLVMGLFTISQLAPTTPNYILRKYFHGLAFIMFLPPIIFTKFDKPRMLIFAFNCVSVLLIYFELLRYNGNIFP